MDSLSPASDQFSDTKTATLQPTANIHFDKAVMDYDQDWAEMDSMEQNYLG